MPTDNLDSINYAGNGLNLTPALPPALAAEGWGHDPQLANRVFSARLSSGRMLSDSNLDSPGIHAKLEGWLGTEHPVARGAQRLHRWVCGV